MLIPPISSSVTTTTKLLPRLRFRISRNRTGNTASTPRAEADQPAVPIRGAWPEQPERLREIAVAAKAHWGYELSWVEEWAAKGDFEPKILGERLVYVAESQGEPIGWAALIPRGAVGWLEDLWIEPGWIGRGAGRLLFQHVADPDREPRCEQ